MLYGASYTRERAAFAQFSKPYRYEHFVFMLRDDKTPESIRLSEWLAEENSDKLPKLVGLIRGFYYGEQLDSIVRNPSAKHSIYEVRWDEQLENTECP